jgi:ActR/RegA family two-component response regulator/predicted regulator of Ras-like GTPase activity (Roadblock/LC7/MglB family)
MFSSVLFIDDDLNLLRSFKRALAHDFELVVAGSPEEGLRIMEEQGPFAVIVSDMKMPKMSGVEVLSRARELHPDTVRVLLTGYADQQSAIDAVNKGEVFRYLTKPCELETLTSTLRAGIRQHHLAIAEKELLEHTLLGIVGVLSQILSLVNPVAQGKANRLKQYCRHIAETLRLKDAWLVEMAAMLSQLGCLTIPPEILARHGSGAALRPEERAMLHDHPQLAVKLLMCIPRFEDVVEIISLQDKPVAAFPRYADPEREARIHRCGRILRTSMFMDRLLTAGTPPAEALETMRTDPEHDDDIVAACAAYDFGLQNMVRMEVRCDELNTHMVLDEDVFAATGSQVAAKGERVTTTLLTGLRNYSHTVGVREPFAVLIPLVHFAP